jgi:outer membrane protein assembly factor BamB
VWALRTLDTDVWTSVCRTMTTCGPDFDFGSAPNEFTATIDGVARRLVGIGQKSGVYWAADAATGELVWQTKVGPGSASGGIMWGSATDGKRIYVAVMNGAKESYQLIDGTTTTGGAWSALDPATGKILWQTADPQGVGDFGYVSTANGVVYVGSSAAAGNTMYALDAATGSIRWRYASGGSVMGGAAIVNGIVYWASGYYTRFCPSGLTCGTNTTRLFAFGLNGPSVPTTVGVSRTGTGQATIWWQPPKISGNSAISGYRITRDGVDSTGAGFTASTVAATTRSFTVSNLVAGRTYTLTVQAINAVGTGPAAAGAVKMSTSALPTAPTAVTVTQTAAGAGTIRWAPPTSAGGGSVTGYRVSRNGLDSAGVGPYSTVVGASARSFTMTRLVVGRTYSLTVRAMTAIGTGPAASGSVTIH